MLGRAEALRCKADWVPLLIITQLGQDPPHHIARDISLESKAHILVGEFFIYLI